MPLPEFGHGWVLFLDVAGLVWDAFDVKPFLGLLAGSAFGVAKKDHGGSPPVVGYLRVSPLEVLYAIATWKTMGFAAILRLSTSLPYQNRFANPVGNQLPVTGGVVFQQRLHLLRKLRSGKIGDFQLLTIQAFHGVNLPVEGGLERTSLCLGNQGLGVYLKGIIHYVREEPRTLVKDGAVVKGAIPGENGNIVQMAVVIEDKTVDFKQQCQVLGEKGKSCDACRFFCQIGHPLFVTGQPIQRFGEGLSCVLQEQMGQRYD